MNTAEQTRASVEAVVAPAHDENRLRHDAISFPEALAQSVSVMAPAMSAAFITYLAAIKAGGATPLAFLLAMVSCLLIGGVVSTFALRLPSAGSLYTDSESAASTSFAPPSRSPSKSREALTAGGSAARPNRTPAGAPSPPRSR